MKCIVKLFIIFLISLFLIVFSSGDKSFSSAEQFKVKSIDSIQCIKTEKVFLVSNNILKGHLFSRKIQNNNSFTSLLLQNSTFNIADNYLYNVIVGFFSDFKFSLSHNLNNSYLIRAP